MLCVILTVIALISKLKFSELTEDFFVLSVYWNGKQEDVSVMVEIEQVRYQSILFINNDLKLLKKLILTVIV